MNRLRCIAIFTLLLAPASLSAEGVVILLEDGTIERAISHADLLAALPEEAGPVLAIGPAGRGTTLLATDQVLYRPGPELWSSGSDSFRFAAATGGGGVVWETVYLTLGVQGSLDFEERVESPHTVDWLDLDGGDRHRVTVNDESPIVAPYDLSFDLESTDDIYLRAGTKPGNGTGGKLSGGIDPGGDLPPWLSRVTIAKGVDALGDWLMRLDVEQDPSGLTMVAAARERAGAVVQTVPQPLPSESFELHWWASSEPGSRDGGLWLVLDGELAASLSGLDNHGTDPAAWLFGAMDQAGEGGRLYLDELEVWSADRLPRFPPLLSDHFSPAAGDPGIWSEIGCQHVNFGADEGHLVVPVDAQEQDCWLGSEISVALPRVRVRLRVDARDLQLQTGDRIGILQASGDGVAYAATAAVQLRQTAIRLEARLITRDGTQVHTTPWRPVPEDAPFELETHWWTASTRGDDGGALLWLDGLEIGRIAGLANSELTVDELRLGVFDPDSGSVGTLVFDQLEAWR